MKDIDEASMKRQVMMAVIKLGGEAVLIALVVGIAIELIGHWRKWGTSSQYSNAFFIAGALLLIGGGFSRRAAGQEWDTFRRISAESFRGMSPVEQANFIVEASSSMRLVIIGFTSGILLMLISLLVW